MPLFFSTKNIKKKRKKNRDASTLYTLLRLCLCNCLRFSTKEEKKEKKEKIKYTAVSSLRSKPKVDEMKAILTSRESESVPPKPQERKRKILFIGTHQFMLVLLLLNFPSYKNVLAVLHDGQLMPWDHSMNRLLEQKLAVLKPSNDNNYEWCSKNLLTMITCMQKIWSIGIASHIFYWK